MQNNFSTPFIDYIPAELHAGKIWYINYYVVDPVTSKLKEKRMKFNKVKSLTERRKLAKKTILEINKKLQFGWNPFLEEDAPKSFTKVIDGLDIFIRAKSKELRADSMRSYTSMAGMLKEWLKDTENEDMLLINFNKNVTYSFTFYLDSKGVSNRTYNNYVKFFRIIFNWLKSSMYVSSNHFISIPVKKSQKKTRVIIPSYTREKIKEALIEDNELEFLAVCLLVFGSLIRPKEISYLKKEHFNFDNQTIVLPHEVTKNGNIRISTIPSHNIKLLEYCVNRAGYGQYVFGKALKPSAKKECPRVYAKKWEYLRKRLDLSMDMKLYSLRDSGIVQLLSDGVSPHEVMRLADHKDLTTTTMYLPYANPKGSDVIKEKSRGF